MASGEGRPCSQCRRRDVARLILKAFTFHPGAVSPVARDLLSRYLCKQFVWKQGGSARPNAALLVQAQESGGLGRAGRGRPPHPQAARLRSKAALCLFCPPLVNSAGGTPVKTSPPECRLHHLWVSRLPPRCSLPPEKRRWALRGSTGVRERP